MKKKPEFLQNTLSIIFLFLPLLVFVLSHNELVITLLLSALIIAVLLPTYQKNEYKLFLFGFILSFILEIGSDKIYKLQYWQQASFFGIPLWLPLLYGYAFVVIRRIGNMVVGSKK